MALGRKTGGRRKGVPNKMSGSAREVIAQVAENIGGVGRLTKWVRESSENERSFWVHVYPRLLPLQLAGDQANPIVHVVRRVIVAPDSGA